MEQTEVNRRLLELNDEAQEINVAVQQMGETVSKIIELQRVFTKRSKAIVEEAKFISAMMGDHGKD